VSGWGRHLDDLAGAVTHLLLDGVIRQTALADPPAALAARDAVLAELRELPIWRTRGRPAEECKKARRAAGPFRPRRPTRLNPAGRKRRTPHPVTAR
jgi:hypothetical protein